MFYTPKKSIKILKMIKLFRFSNLLYNLIINVICIFNCDFDKKMIKIFLKIILSKKMANVKSNKTIQILEETIAHFKELKLNNKMDERFSIKKITTVISEKNKKIKNDVKENTEKKELTAYCLYVQENFSKVKEENPDNNDPKEIMKIIAKMWKTRDVKEAFVIDVDNKYVVKKTTKKKSEHNEEEIIVESDVE